MKQLKEMAIKAWEKLIWAYNEYKNNPSWQFAWVLIKSVVRLFIILARLWLLFHD